MTVAEFCGRWTRGLEGRVAPTTVRAYRGACARQLVPHFGAVALADLTTPLIRGWLSERLAAGAARNTVSSELTALSALLTDAVLEGLIAGNPAHGAMRRLWERAPRRPEGTDHASSSRC